MRLHKPKRVRFAEPVSQDDVLLKARENQATAAIAKQPPITSDATSLSGNTSSLFHTSVLEDDATMPKKRRSERLRSKQQQVENTESALRKK